MSKLALSSIVCIALPVFLGFPFGCASGHEGKHESSGEHAEEGEESEAEEAEEADEEVVIEFKQATAGAQESFHRVAGSAVATRVVREGSDEHREFEFEYQEGGRACSLRTTEGGDVLEVEQGMAPESAPPAVVHALQKKFKNAKVEKLERVQAFHYEVQVTVDGKKQSVSVSPNGQIEHKEESD